MAGRIRIGAFVGVAIVCLPTVATAATAQFRQGVNGYIGTADTHIRADQPTNRFPSATTVLVDGANPVAHGLIRFDHIFGDGPGQVPSNATIHTATLTLRTSNQGDPVWFHRMLVAWDETNNWNELSTGGLGLQADGIEMAEAPDFTFTPSGPVPRVDTFDVTLTVQGWLAGTFPNYGWGITNQISDGWIFDSSENATVINRPLLEITFTAPPTDIQIVTQPAGARVAEGGSATFSVAVTGTEPIYQWFHDGIEIPDATNASHTIPFVRRGDEGDYTVRVTNEISSATSDVARLEVDYDLTPPHVICVYGTNDSTTLFVVFSETVTNADDRERYSLLRSDGGPLVISSATYAPGGTIGSVVVLKLDAATPLNTHSRFVLEIAEIYDLFGNLSDPARTKAVALYVQPIFSISEFQLWKFDDSGDDLGEAWRDFAFDDSGWGSGPALLGFETAALPEPLRTPLRRTNEFGTVIRTHYLRTRFNYSVSAGEGVLRFRTVLDDAAAIYLNGVEAFRMRLPAGPLNYLTEGVGSVVGDATYEGPFTICVSNLLNGDNVLAVEVHQSGFNSSDMVWGLELQSVFSDPPPDCFFGHPTNQVVEAGDPVSFSVEYSCPYVAVQWIKDGVPIPNATNLIYAISSAGARDAGDYAAVINSIQSAPARLTVLSCCAPEVVAVYATNAIIVLQFNEETTNGLDLLNFRVDAADASHSLTLASAAYSSGTNVGTTLLLRIDPSTPMRENRLYNLSMEDIEDLFGNKITPQTWPIALFPSSIIGLNATQQWRYETSGTDLSNTWYRADYDDSAWPVGAALFDAKRPPRGQVSGQPVRTITTLSNSTATAQIPTHYFRTRFNYAGPLSHTVCIRPFIDDGAVYYLNGREILRVGMFPTARIFYTTTANRTVNDANFEGPYYVAVTNLVAGENILAVEVHQQSLTSSDLTFGTEFGLLSTLPPRRMSITLTNSTHAVLRWGGSAILEQNSDSANSSGWMEVEGAVSGHSVPVTAKRFFRLREP